ncbi:MAG: hypothetical protein AB7E48_02470 [Deferribacterales bacterium]
MKRFTALFILLLMVAGCDFFLRATSGNVTVIIGDNGSDNKTDRNGAVFYVYAAGEKKPFAAVDTASGLFFYASDNGTEKRPLSGVQGVFTASAESSLGETELFFADICENGFPAEKDAALIRRNWESFAAACDFGGCAPEGFDISAYAERNGFDAYCSAE